MRTAIRVCVGLCWTLAAPATAPAQTPLSLGEVVLLGESTEHTADAGLKQALLDADPGVRQIAGRVAGIGNHSELLGNVIGALVREQDPDAGAELVRAALYLGAGRDRELLGRQAERLGGPAVLVLAEWSARTQPADLIAGLEAWVPQAGRQTHLLAELVALAAARYPASRGDLVVKWMAVAPPGGWRQFLALDDGADADRAGRFLKNALASPRASVREETVWFLVAGLNDGAKLSPEILDAAIAPAMPDASEWERFGRELIARRRKKISTPDRSQLLAAEGARRGAAWTLSKFRELTDAERAAMPSRNTPSAPPGVAIEPRRTKARQMRTANLPVDGALAAAVTAAGCRPPVRSVGVAKLMYAPDGRPRHIELDVSLLEPPACQKVMTALARLTIAGPREGMADEAMTVAVPFHQAFFDCATATPSPAESDDSYATSPPADTTSPRLIRQVKASYTEAAFLQNIGGVVELEAVVTEKGCVTAVKVIRSIPLLDAAAIGAVTQWQFEPGRVRGRAVPVIIAAELTFRR